MLRTKIVDALKRTDYGADVNINRVAVSGGWFVTKNIMAKAEYVSQNYNGFVSTDLRNGGKFNGLVIEAVVGF